MRAPHTQGTRPQHAPHSPPARTPKIALHVPRSRERQKHSPLKNPINARASGRRSRSLRLSLLERRERERERQRSPRAENENTTHKTTPPHRRALCRPCRGDHHHTASLRDARRLYQPGWLDALSIDEPSSKSAPAPRSGATTTTPNGSQTEGRCSRVNQAAESVVHRPPSSTTSHRCETVERTRCQTFDHSASPATIDTRRIK